MRACRVSRPPHWASRISCWPRIQTVVPGAASPNGRRRLLIATNVVVVVTFLLLLLGGHTSLLRSDFEGGFYDAQARSFLHGRLDVPASKLYFEALFTGHKAYMYFGPWPALLRMPIELFTHDFDGRLTRLSMLIAFAVAMIFATRLVLRVRALFRPNDPVSRFENYATAAFIFVLGIGSVLFFLGSVGIVYHEADLWGTALAIGSFDVLIAYCVAPSRRGLALASLLALLAIMSRASVGSGPVLAIVGILVASLTESTRKWAGLSALTRGASTVRDLSIAFVVPLALYMAVNYAKFRTLLSIPLNRQYTFLRISPNRRAALAANGNSLFGVKFMPTQLVQAFRPDGIRITSVFPWVKFPPPATLIGSARFTGLEPSTSLVASMPFLMVLAAVGLVVLARRQPEDHGQIASLRIPVVGAAFATIPTIGIGYVANRYLSDFVPLMLLLAALGLHVTLRWMSQSGRRAITRGVSIALAFLALFSLWANVGLAELYGHSLAGGYLTEWSIARYVRLQNEIHRWFPGGNLPGVHHGETLPARPGQYGSLFVLGDCRGLYWSTGSAWLPIERTNATGYRRFSVTFADQPGVWQPFFVAGDVGNAAYVAAQVTGSKVRFAYFTNDPRRRQMFTGPHAITIGKPAVVDLVYDQPAGQLSIRVNGDVLWKDILLPLPVADPGSVGYNNLGGTQVATRFAGTVTELPVKPTFCRTLTQ
jgi:hypothetical protein